MHPGSEVVEVERENPRFTTAEARAFLEHVARAFEVKPFKPHSVFRNGHAQTLAAYAWPRLFRFYFERDQERFFEVEPGVKVLAHCRWQANPIEHPTIVIWHGVEGSTSSNYMLAIAEKGSSAGFNVVRVNLRSCGGTEHLTSTIYHGGQTEDLNEVVRQLIEEDHLPRLFLVGFSLGGNMVLKLAGEFGVNPPKEVLGVCAVSPSVDLTASADLLKKRSNRIYERDFVHRLKQRLRTKHKLFPGIYNIDGLESVRTLWEFDDRFTARAHGFADAKDYYYKASAIRVTNQIQIPTLIIHAQDDPFIPFAPLRDPSIANNPYIILIGPECGGHVAFVAGMPSASLSVSADGSKIEDRFWAENRIVEFCRLANEIL